MIREYFKCNYHYLDKRIIAITTSFRQKHSYNEVMQQNDDDNTYFDNGGILTDC